MNFSDEIKEIWKYEGWSTGNKVRNTVLCFFDYVPNYFLRFQSHNIVYKFANTRWDNFPQTRLAKIWDAFILFLRWLGYKWMSVHDNWR